MAFELLLLEDQFQQVISQTWSPDQSSWSFHGGTTEQGPPFLAGWLILHVSLILELTLQLNKLYTKITLEGKDNTFLKKITLVTHE